jgi:hypothetical protein
MIEAYAYHPVEIRGQSALEQAEGSWLQPNDRTVGVLKLTAGLGLTEGGIQVYEVLDWRDQASGNNEA